MSYNSLINDNFKENRNDEFKMHRNNCILNDNVSNNYNNIMVNNDRLIKPDIDTSINICKHEDYLVKKKEKIEMNIDKNKSLNFENDNNFYYYQTKKENQIHNLHRNFTKYDYLNNNEVITNIMNNEKINNLNSNIVKPMFSNLISPISLQQSSEFLDDN